MDDEGYEDFLFLPFLDDTNGEESYGGGRYVEGRIPDGDILEIPIKELSEIKLSYVFTLIVVTSC